jgi:hypothetical protein
MIWRPSSLIPLLGLLLGAAAPSLLPAQEDNTGVGFELGYSRASFAPGGLTDAHEGSLLGGFVSQRLSGPLSAQAELLFTTKGGSVTLGTPVGPVRAAIQLIYIELPLLARVTLPLGRRVRPVLLGGGSYALSVGCEFQVQVAGAFGQARCDQPGSGLELAKADLSAIVGGGVEYAWRTSAVRLELRRFVGLRDVVEGGEGRNRVWVLLFGITF